MLEFGGLGAKPTKPNIQTKECYMVQLFTLYHYYIKKYIIIGLDSNV